MDDNNKVCEACKLNSMYIANITASNITTEERDHADRWYGQERRKVQHTYEGKCLSRNKIRGGTING